MKEFLRLLSCALAAAFCCTLAAPARAAGQGDLLPCAGDRGRLALTAQQATDYAQRLRDASARAQKEWNENGYSDTYAVYGTLVGTGDNALLWIADYGISSSREADWPGEFGYGGGYATVDFEELWQWDGSKAVAFEPLKAPGAHLALRDNGVEAFSPYLGTDVDGEEWDAFYPFSNGMIAQTPDWCRCWCCAYDYRLKDAGISAEGKTPREIAHTFSDFMMESGTWPRLPFDWSTFHTTDEMWEMASHFTVSGGSGWQQYYGNSGGFPGVYPSDDAVPGAILTAAAMAYADDECWQSADTLAQALDAYAGVEADGADFADVSDNAYYADAIQWAVENGITNGIGNRLFGVGQSVTRGQAVTFLWRAMGEPAPQSRANPFIDVKTDAYYHDAVLWAVENGITNGVSKDRFAPDSSVTRGQLIVFLWRCQGQPGGNAGGAWNEGAERWANGKGLLAGTAKRYLTNDPCPREDVVFYLWKELT